MPTRHKLFKFIFLSMLAGPLIACDAPKEYEQADTIYLNGNVLTLVTPRAAEALAVKDGIIIAVGKKRHVLKHQSKTTKQVELDGKTLMPGFFQTHAHFPFIALKSQLANIDPPPEGDIDSIEKLIAKLRTVAKVTPKGQPVFAIGYDDTLLKEMRHPTKFDLDKISREHPVFVIHISFHFTVLNTAALEKVGITAKTQNPSGGIIRRLANTKEPNGVLEEAAMSYLEGLLPKPNPQELFASYLKTMYLLAAKGYTTVVDHASTPDIEKIYVAMSGMSGAKAMPLDLVAYQRLANLRQPAIKASKEYQGKYRLGGYKIVLDGSIQGFTGYLSQPYHSHLPHHEAGYRGYAHLDEALFSSLVMRAYSQNTPLLVHTNGDAATDLYIKAVKKASAAYPDAEIRPVIIHAQTMREDQLDAAKKLNMLPSFFVDHVYFWGDRHRDIFLGNTRAQRISPTGSAIAKGIVFTLHDDAPIVTPDPLRSAWVAVNRITSSGKELGARQRILPLEALKALTLNAAYQHFEENSKGSLEVGKKADMIILNANPLTVAPSAIKDIQVMQTIKDGETIFQR